MQKHGLWGEQLLEQKKRLKECMARMRKDMPTITCQQILDGSSSPVCLALATLASEKVLGFEIRDMSVTLAPASLLSTLPHGFV